MLGFQAMFLACSKTYDKIAGMDQQPTRLIAKNPSKTANVALSPFSPAGRQQNKRTSIRNGKRHWIPNSSTRWTDYLSAEKALDLIEGANHARELGFPLNLSLTIHFERGNLNPIYTPQMAIGYFLKAANQWLALRGIPATFIWVREHVIGTGRHVHILLHCPLEYQAEFKKRAKQKWVLLAGMDKADRDTLHFERIGPRGYAEGQASTRDRQKYLNQLKGSLKYHLKGIDPDQALPRVTGDNRPIAELLGIEPEGNQPIYGRRASQSQNISRGARERYAAGKQQSEATTASQ
jgi:hypothetical protein